MKLPLLLLEPIVIYSMRGIYIPIAGCDCRTNKSAPIAVLYTYQYSSQEPERGNLPRTVICRTVLLEIVVIDSTSLAMVCLLVCAVHTRRSVSLSVLGNQLYGKPTM